MNLALQNQPMGILPSGVKSFNTHAKAMGKTTKPKSDNQIRKWLQNPQSDSAEYKMWGNGVALPNVYFVLSGIMYYAQESAT